MSESVELFLNGAVIKLTNAIQEKIELEIYVLLYLLGGFSTNMFVCHQHDVCVRRSSRILDTGNYLGSSLRAGHLANAVAAVTCIYATPLACAIRRRIMQPDHCQQLDVPQDADGG